MKRVTEFKSLWPSRNNTKRKLNIVVEIYNLLASRKMGHDGSLKKKKN